MFAGQGNLERGQAQMRQPLAWRAQSQIDIRHRTSDGVLALDLGQAIGEGSGHHRRPWLTHRGQRPGAHASVGARKAMTENASPGAHHLPLEIREGQGAEALGERPAIALPQFAQVREGNPGKVGGKGPGHAPGSAGPSRRQKLREIRGQKRAQTRDHV